MKCLKSFVLFFYAVVKSLILLSEGIKAITESVINNAYHTSNKN